MHWVYVIYSIKNGRYYIDSTSDLKRRLQEHNNNKTKSLKNRGPFNLIYREVYPTLLGARKREKQIKQYKGGNAFKKLIGVS